MRPWIWPGGTLGVQSCSVSELSVGDIAVWFDGRELRSHRVIAVERGRFVTRGDLGIRDDPAASDAELMGRAVSFEMRGVRYRLDRGLPHAAGALLAGAPWMGATFRRVYDPPRRFAGRLADRLYTAGPVRRFRRRVHTPAWELAVDRTPRGVRITALRGTSVSGRIHVRNDGAIEQLWVKRSQRGLGLGRLLLKRAVAECRRAGVAEPHCSAAIQTHKGTRLFASYGPG